MASIQSIQIFFVDTAQFHWQKILHIFVSPTLFVKDLVTLQFQGFPFFSTLHLPNTVFLCQIDENVTTISQFLATATLSNFSFSSFSSSKTWKISFYFEGSKQYQLSCPCLVLSELLLSMNLLWRIVAMNQRVGI